MADASYLLREAGRSEDAKEMQERVHASGDYYTALNIISEYVETELSIDKEKSRRRNRRKEEPADEGTKNTDKKG